VSGVNLTELIRRAALTTPAATTPARPGTLGIPPLRVPTRLSPYALDPTDADDREAFRRREQNAMRDPRDPAFNTMFDCEPECSGCGNVESECDCGGLFV
jgi:hypothetical protein